MQNTDKINMYLIWDSYVYLLWEMSNIDRDYQI